MMTESSIATRQNTERLSLDEPTLRWLPPFLLGLAIVGEGLVLLLMTLYRYRNQGLEPEFLDFTKTANIIGFLLETPFIALFVVMILLRRFHTIKLAGTAAALSCASLVVLSSAPMLSLPETWLPNISPYIGYILFLMVKVVELGIFVVTLRTPSRPFWRKAMGVVIFALVTMTLAATVLIATVLLSPVGSTITDQPQQAEYDAGVILGAAVWSGDRPSPVLRERIYKGFDLLQGGVVQNLVLTGGHAPNELPEAEVGRRELLKLGADPTRIVLETSTSSTLEQVLFIRRELQKKQGWSSFIIVSDQFHLKRALEICQFNGIDAIGVSSESPLGPQNLALYHIRESVALILYWLFGV